MRTVAQCATWCGPLRSVPPRSGATPSAVLIWHPAAAILQSAVVAVNAHLQHGCSALARQRTRHVAGEQPGVKTVGPAGPRLTVLDCLSQNLAHLSRNRARLANLVRPLRQPGSVPREV